MGLDNNTQLNYSDKTTIKNWFKTGLKPTQNQYWAQLDSYWHKGEKLPISSIESLSELIDNKVDYSALSSFSVKKINTIEELRNTIGQEDQVVELLGYYLSGDKAPLNYKWTPINVPDDGGKYINSLNGTWVAQFNDSASSKDFGAKTDGLTNDLEFIKKLLTHNFSNYEISDNSRVDGMIIIKSKIASKIKVGRLSSIGSEFIRLIGCSNIDLIGGKLNGNSDTNTVGIRVQSSRFINILDFNINNLGNSTRDQIRGITFEGDCSFSTVDNVMIDGLTGATTTSGVSFIKSNGVGSKYVTLKNSTIQNLSPREDSDGFKILQGGLDNYLTIDNVTFIDCAKRGIKLQGRNNVVNNVKVMGNTYFAGIDAQEGFTTITNSKITFDGAYENGISLCDSNNFIQNVDIIGVYGVIYPNSTRGIRLDKSTEFATNLNGNFTIIRDVRIRNTGRPIYLRNITENPKFNITIENIEVRDCNYSYVISLENLNISNLKINDVNVYDNLISVLSIINIPASVSISNAYIRNSNVRMLSGSVAPLRDVSVDYVDFGYINTNIQRIEQNQDLRKITTNYAPTNESIKPYLLNSKPGDELINNYQAGDFANIKGYVCVTAGNGVDNVGTWKTLRIIDRSVAVPNVATSTASTIEQLAIDLNTLITTVNAKLKADRDSGQQATQ